MLPPWQPLPSRACTKKEAKRRSLRRPSFLFPSRQNALSRGRVALRCQWQIQQSKSVCRGRQEASSLRRAPLLPGTANGEGAQCAHWAGVECGKKPKSYYTVTDLPILKPRNSTPAPSGHPLLGRGYCCKQNFTFLSVATFPVFWYNGEKTTEKLVKKCTPKSSILLYSTPA